MNVGHDRSAAAPAGRRAGRSAARPTRPGVHAPRSSGTWQARRSEGRPHPVDRAVPRRLTASCGGSRRSPAASRATRCGGSGSRRTARESSDSVVHDPDEAPGIDMRLSHFLRQERQAVAAQGRVQHLVRAGERHLPRDAYLDFLAVLGATPRHRCRRCWRAAA